MASLEVASNICQALNGGGSPGGAGKALRQTLVRTLDLADVVVVPPWEEQEGAAAAAEAYTRPLFSSTWAVFGH
jgi:hypothetical protein